MRGQVGPSDSLKTCHIHQVDKIYIYIPRPSKGIKFQPPGLFLVVKGHKFHTLGGFRYIYIYDMI